MFSTSYETFLFWVQNICSLWIFEFVAIYTDLIRKIKLFSLAVFVKTFSKWLLIALAPSIDDSATRYLALLLRTGFSPDWCLKRTYQQDGRLAPAYFAPNYNYFDQLLPTVKKKTTVPNLVFKEFLQPSIPPLISVLYAKGYHNFQLRTFCLTVPNTGNLLCFRKFLVSKNYMDKMGGGGREGVLRFSVKIFLSHSAESFRRGIL